MKFNYGDEILDRSTKISRCNSQVISSINFIVVNHTVDKN